LTDKEWQRIKPLLPDVPRRGRKPTRDLRGVLNAIRTMARSGSGWRMSPEDFPLWPTVYGWFWRFVRLLLFRTIRDVALMPDTTSGSGREASLSGGILDSQSVRAPHDRTRSCDAGKKVVRRKRHIAVGTDGQHSMVDLTSADVF
jgi:transposase